MNVSQSLRDTIEKFLGAEFYSKSESDLTPADQLIVETGEAFCRLLRRRAARTPDSKPHRTTDDSMVTVMRSYNDINRDYDLLDADLSLADKIRQGRRGNR